MKKEKIKDINKIWIFDYLHALYKRALKSTNEDPNEINQVEEIYGKIYEYLNK